ncbi:HAMP domain-containing histidine kinase [Dorea acetigenes]|uniref:histidine kinase n=1 Tax=Dorea acetigenes TaxID=2981787 RepID=A0ABT2RMQ9_9FIRM|nr:HAMP domain-containing sensor histidine kinase [Dorea acetigenes]MCB6414616.1 HAMP domain-containing histidine kinase [Faecalimonas umbilicata]MCU6686694.1 HAMP domain-containing histidine kinase [Dorea acetigenes]SCJ06997.1 Sensor protein kinase walK [uncultured Clostridium sp.]
MEMWLCAVIGILVLKIYLLRKSVREIEDGFVERLTTDTNTLIDISSHDKAVKDLANTINGQLRQLREERHRFCQGDRELKDAVTNISHDLRTPLTAICGYLDLLEQEEKSEAAERYTEIIRNRTELLKQLTEELFRYSIVLADENDRAREPVVLNHVLEESIAAFYTSFRERGIQPDIRLPKQPVVRMLDPVTLPRVFSNLLHNAMKYSDGDLQITLTQDGEITFINQASSLNEVQVGRLFDRFYTVETARKSTGLGLAIARRLVGQMGGSISAEYKDGKLCIRILFPAIYKIQ